MIAYIIRRIIQSIVVMLAVALIAFSLFRYVGDPVVSMVGRDTTYEQREALRKELGFDGSGGGSVRTVRQKRDHG